MGMPEQLANAGLRPDLEGISQLNNIGRAVGPGETAEGFLFSDTWQMQFTASHVFGPKFGSDNFVLLGEVHRVLLAHRHLNQLTETHVKAYIKVFQTALKLTHLRQTTRGAIAYWRLLITTQYLLV